MNKTNTLKMFSVIALVIVCQLFVAPVADAAGWKILGITNVKGTLDRDVVKVTAKKGLFRSIKIKVRTGPLEMKKLIVHFGNGEIQDIAIRKHFGKNTESRVIDLKGQKRAIKKVVFWYAKKKWAGPKPTVVLWGKS